MLRIFIFATSKREDLNKALAYLGIIPMDTDEKVRISTVGTFYLTDHLPDDMKENGFTFEVEDDYELLERLWNV